jgi:hypothetical protein
MATFMHGKNTKVYANGYDLSGFFNNVDLSLESPALDKSVFQTAYKEFLAALIFSGSFKLDGLWSGAATDANAILQALFLAGTTLNVTYLLNSDTAGQPGFGLPSKATGHAVSSSITDLVRLSADATVTGQPLMGISLAALAQRTEASQTTTGVDMGAGYTATTAGVLFQVTELTGGDTSVVLTVETASDDAFTSDLATIATATATAIGAYYVTPAAQSVLRYVRLKAACGAGETCTVHALLHTW